MNINSAIMYNSVKPINFGKLVAGNDVSPYTVKKLNADCNFNQLVESTDANGYDIHIQRDENGYPIIWLYEQADKAWKEHLVLASSDASRELNPKHALDSWYKVKPEVELGKEARNKDNLDQCFKLAGEFNKEMGFSSGGLRVGWGITPSELKKLLTDDKFITLVDNAQYYGYVTTVEGHFKDRSISVDTNDHLFNYECLEVTPYSQPFDTSSALESWEKMQSRKNLKPKNA